MVRQCNSSVFEELRRKYPLFIYESYSISENEKGLVLEWVFKTGELEFRPTTVIPHKNNPFLLSASDERLKNIVFQIGMIELVSYWKSVCSPVVIIKPYKLSEEALSFWKKIYFNGLGEFFYLNSISIGIEEFMEIRTEGAQIPEVTEFLLNDKVMVPVGGGKDSVVTLELLRKSGLEVVPFIMNPRGATVKSVEAAEIDGFLEINRTIHPLLLDLNAKGYLNGHTPFSAALAFYVSLMSILTGIKHIALSNESSANEPTVKGEEVNHQYSKSLEFETDFKTYFSKYVSKSVNYFSFLRPLSELQIGMLFSSFDHYHKVFRSCNAGSKQDIWCGNCPKCLFTFILLSPFFSIERLVEIFGKNLFEDESLLSYFNELTGVSDVKPFECVGTTEEVNIALSMHLENQRYDTLPYLLDVYSKSSLYTHYQKTDIETFLNVFEKDHYLEPAFEEILKKALYDRVNKK